MFHCTSFCNVCKAKAFIWMIHNSVLHVPFHWLKLRCQIYMTPLRPFTFLPEDKCEVTGQPTVLQKSPQWLNCRGTDNLYCFDFYKKNDLSRSEPQKTQTLIKTSRSLSSHVCVLKLYFSHLFILMQGELKCYNLTSGWLISHEAVIHHISSGVGLQGSNGICCGNQSGQH